ncbi:MAG: ribonuclease R [Bacteroidia bacterium]|nr:MAG: ribonuclease R [Bacteroidia bacterium]
MSGRKNKKPKKLPAYNRKTLQNVVMEIFRSRPKEHLNYKQIARKLSISDLRTRQLLSEILNQLKDAGKLEQIQRGKYKFVPTSGSLVTGKVQLISSGAAFVTSETDEEDIFIPRKYMNQALNGDTVEVIVWARRKKRSPEGEIVNIIKRNKTKFSGVVSITKDKIAFLIVTEKHMPYDIFIPQNKLNHARHGQKAVAEITEWSHSGKNPVGEIIDILGEQGENNAEMHAILTEFNLPYKYPEQLEQMANKISTKIPEEEIKKRRDFRAIPTFTIDPKDAKDFDDALSFRELEVGKYEVGVHIADVTHYVQEQSPIDKEAQERATSVYLVDRTIPMLPEQLSNQLCSLRPNEDKLCYSAVFIMDKEANIHDKWFGRTLINSDKRFTYSQAQAIIESGSGSMEKEITSLNNLAKILRKKRFHNGSISFERTEVKFRLDKDGKPLSVYFKEAQDSNRLIEEFMLLANQSVAQYIGKELKKPFVYRVHDEPDMEKLYNFSNFIKQFGYHFTFKEESEVAANLNRLLYQVKGKNEQNMVEQLAVKSMAKAEYSPENSGHYGLGFSFYTHFTSPIRRYPDMMVHRLLTRYMNQGKPAMTNLLKKQCTHASEMERRAVLAERASVKYKQAEFLFDKLGSVFDAVITGVTERGLYAEIVENKIEGMIAMRNLDDDFYVFDEKNYCITGERTKQKYQLGDSVKIQVTKINMENRTIDFVIADTF